MAAPRRCTDRCVIRCAADAKLVDEYDEIEIESDDTSTYPEDWDENPNVSIFEADAELLESVLPKCLKRFTFTLPLYSTESTGDHAVDEVRALIEHGQHLERLHITTAIPPDGSECTFAECASTLFFKEALQRLFRSLRDADMFKKLQVFTLHLEGDPRVPKWIKKNEPLIRAALVAKNTARGLDAPMVPEVSIYATQTLALEAIGFQHHSDSRTQ